MVANLALSVAKQAAATARKAVGSRGSAAKAATPDGSTTKVTKAAPAPKTTTKAPSKAAPAKKSTATKAAPARKTATKAAPAKKAPATKAAPAKKAAATKAAPATKAAATKAAPAKKAPATKAAPTTKTATKAAPPARTTATTRKAAPVTKAPAATRASSAKKAARAPVLVVREDETPWTAKELKAVRAELEHDIEQLRSEVAHAQSDLVDLMRDSGDGAGDDQADAGAKTYEREQEISLANNAREMLEQNEHALERLDNGTYGICESCGNPIGKLRLQAAPRATLCMPCKKKQERR